LNNEERKKRGGDLRLKKRMFLIWPPAENVILAAKTASGKVGIELPKVIKILTLQKLVICNQRLEQSDVTE